MKAREIREKLQGKIDPALLQTLEAMAIQVGQTEKVITELTGLVQMCVMSCESFNMVADGMKAKLQALEGMKPVDAITGEKH